MRWPGQLKRSGWCGLHGNTKLCWRIIQQALNTHQSTNTLLFRSSSVKHPFLCWFLVSLSGVHILRSGPSGPSDLWFTTLSLPSQLPDNDLEGTTRITAVTPVQPAKNERQTPYQTWQSLSPAVPPHLDGPPAIRNLQVHGKSSPRLSCFYWTNYHTV